MKKNNRKREQAGAELCQAQVKLVVIVEVKILVLMGGWVVKKQA